LPGDTSLTVPTAPGSTDTAPASTAPGG
jgi:hypothetical protein